MKRYSKPLGKLLDFKQDFFHLNDSKLREYIDIAEIYGSQPRRVKCKNRLGKLDFSPQNSFLKLGIEFSLCPRCGHCNGAHEDTDDFVRFLYAADRGQSYAKNYLSSDIQQYRKRVTEVYLPKAMFLKDALAELGETPGRLTDFGAGAGYFVCAAMECGFSNVFGYEPSETLVNLGNAMMGSHRLTIHDPSSVVFLIEGSDAAIASFLGVMEHLRTPREALAALSKNRRIEYVFMSVPLFSPTVVIESVFPEIMPRHLAGGHTHLYSESSIQFFCDEFGFDRLSEWWFGLDATDLYRSSLVSLRKMGTLNVSLQTYWTESFLPLIDKIQEILDEAHLCSEVHMLLGKKES